MVIHSASQPAPTTATGISDQAQNGAASHANQAIADDVAQVAERKGITPAQVALAWVHARGARLGISLAPIPGTKRVKWLEQNVAAAQITLDSDDLAVLDPLGDNVVGARY